MSIIPNVKGIILCSKKFRKPDFTGPRFQSIEKKGCEFEKILKKIHTRVTNQCLADIKLKSLFLPKSPSNVFIYGNHSSSMGKAEEYQISDIE